MNKVPTSWRTRRDYMLAWGLTLALAAATGVVAAIGWWPLVPVEAFFTYMTYKSGQKLLFHNRNLDALDAARALLSECHHALDVGDQPRFQKLLAEAQEIGQAVSESEEPSYF